MFAGLFGDPLANLMAPIGERGARACLGLFKGADEAKAPEIISQLLS